MGLIVPYRTHTKKLTPNIGSARACARSLGLGHAKNAKISYVLVRRSVGDTDTANVMRQGDPHGSNCAVQNPHKKTDS